MLNIALLAACSGEPGASPSSTPAPAVGPVRGEAASTPPVQTGAASYYAPELAGKRTASGEPFRPRAMTAASRSLPLGADARVTNTETGRSVTVEVNDRGPYVGGRILDVSPKAAERLGMKADGTAKVVVRPLPEDRPPAR